jgi:uncharacterized protein YbjT (DUF2867 family)
MESIPLFLFGPLLAMPRLPDIGLRWLAADDYARQVVSALRLETASGRVYNPLGPETLTFRQAGKRFAEAYPRRVLPLQIPVSLFRLAGTVAPMPRYLADLGIREVATRRA